MAGIGKVGSLAEIGKIGSLARLVRGVIVPLAIMFYAGF
jgi:hypothetical protein